MGLAQHHAGSPDPLRMNSWPHLSRLLLPRLVPLPRRPALPLPRLRHHQHHQLLRRPHLLLHVARLVHEGTAVLLNVGEQEWQGGLGLRGQGQGQGTSCGLANGSWGLGFGNAEILSDRRSLILLCVGQQGRCLGLQGAAGGELGTGHCGWGWGMLETCRGNGLELRTARLLYFSVSASRGTVVSRGQGVQGD